MESAKNENVDSYFQVRVRVRGGGAKDCRCWNAEQKQTAGGTQSVKQDLLMEMD